MKRARRALERGVIFHVLVKALFLPVVGVFFHQPLVMLVGVKKKKHQPRGKNAHSRLVGRFDGWHAMQSRARLRSYARAVLLMMRMGEIILLEPKDWNQKRRKPSTYCLMLGREMNRKWICKTIADGSGWMVERVK